METPSGPTSSAVPAQEKKRAPTLYAIIAIKLLKGIGLLILSLGVFMLRNKSLPEMLEKGWRFAHLDPEGKFFESIAERLDTITPANVKSIALGIFLYGVLLMVEGIGLACRARWAVWLVIFQSLFFVPIELDHYIRKGSLLVLGLLVINVAILWYLFQNRHRLFHTKF